MAGNKAGGRKAAEVNIARYGKDFYRRIGKKGGQNGYSGGFSARPSLAQIAGSKGGRNSCRGASLATLKGLGGGAIRVSTKELYKVMMKVVYDIDAERFEEPRFWYQEITHNRQYFDLMNIFINSDAEWEDERTMMCMAVLFGFRRSLKHDPVFDRACTELKTMVVACSSRRTITWKQAEDWFTKDFKRISKKVSNQLQYLPR